MVNCWENDNLLTLLYVMFSCVIATFPCRVLGQVWHLIVSIPDLYHPTYLAIQLLYFVQTQEFIHVLYIEQFYAVCHGNEMDCKHMVWASTQENLASGVCEQHRRRPACASAQSDQRLCYSLFEKNHI